MTARESVLPIIAGLAPYEWLTLIGIIVGPIVAVAVSLWVDGRRKDREQRQAVLRVLLSTRHLVGDPNYSLAINLVPVEFAKFPAVLTAHNEFIAATRFKPTPDNEDAAFKQMWSKQTKLIFEVAKALGYPVRETDLETTAYAADAFIVRDNILVDSQKAMRDIANLLYLQSRQMAGVPLTEEELKFLNLQKTLDAQTH